MARTNSERIEFDGGSGARLAARLDTPRLEPRAYALFAHCFTCSKDIAAASRIARALAERRIGVLRFDFTGIGHSDGEFASTNFSSNVDDLVAAAHWMREQGKAPALLVGHSLGGAAVLAAAGRIEGIRAVTTIGAPADPVHIRKLLAGSAGEIESRGEAEVELGGRRFTIRKQLLDDLSKQRLEEAISKLHCALLVMHAPLDQVVGVDNASRIFLAAKHPKSFISLDNADHLLTNAADARYAGNMIAAWADRFLPGAESLADVRARGDEVVVAENGEGKFGQTVAAGSHTMLADEPTAVGGNDTGPNPYAFLLAGLGACTSMTLRLYAERKNLALDHVSVRLRHEKVHAEDCGACETKSGKIDRIDREIVIEGNLSDEERKRLLEIADRCPVHRTLHSEIAIVTRETDS